ncbi:MAG TPA: hypothetical protein VJ733_06180 [Candidatus Binatia bacterium]|nr:hypothetical protein [Candidatus Binatia bacterium]
MNLRDHLERKSEIRPNIDNGGIVQKIYRPPVDSWFQKRLVYVRNELRKEIQTKVIRLTKDQ